MYPHCTVRIRLLYAFNKYFDIDFDFDNSQALSMDRRSRASTRHQFGRVLPAHQRQPRRFTLDGSCDELGVS